MNIFLLLENYLVTINMQLENRGTNSKGEVSRILGITCKEHQIFGPMAKGGGIQTKICHIRISLRIHKFLRKILKIENGKFWFVCHDPNMH